MGAGLELSRRHPRLQGQLRRRLRREHGSGNERRQCAQGTGDCQWWAIGGLVQHTPTGIYVYGGYGNNQIDLKAAQAGKDNESDTWYVQAGVERKWFELGKTNVFGEYRNDDVGLTVAADTSDLDLWAVGIAQNIEKADLTFYALYRHYEGDYRRAQHRRQNQRRRLRRGYHRRQDQLLTRSGYLIPPSPGDRTKERAASRRRGGPFCAQAEPTAAFFISSALLLGSAAAPAPLM